MLANAFSETAALETAMSLHVIGQRTSCREMCDTGQVQGRGVRRRRV